MDARNGALIELDFPAAEVIAAKIPDQLLKALGINEAPKFYGLKSDFGMGFIEVASESTVRNLKPNQSALKEIDLPAVVVTAKADAGADYDFVSRFFGPNIAWMCVSPPNGSF